MNGLTPGNIDENNINTLLACIAFQELSLSHPQHPWRFASKLRSVPPHFLQSCTVK
jgi:hypothetical protein